GAHGQPGAGRGRGGAAPARPVTPARHRLRRGAGRPHHQPRPAGPVRAVAGPSRRPRAPPHPVPPPPGPLRPLARPFPAPPPADRRDSELVGYEEQMERPSARTSVAVCRAGAITVAELAAAGVPAVLVPLPGAPGDHQTRNAEALVDAGAAIIVPDADCDAAR